MCCVTAKSPPGRPPLGLPLVAPGRGLFVLRDPEQDRDISLGDLGVPKGNRQEWLARLGLHGSSFVLPFYQTRRTHKAGFRPTARPAAASPPTSPPALWGGP